MPLSPQSRIMSLSEIQLRDPSPVVCSAAQISCFFPLLKPPLAPELPGRCKITGLSAKCGRCFSRISWPGEYCLSPPECKQSTLCCHFFCLGWLVKHSLPHKGCSCAVERKKNKDESSEFMPRPSPHSNTELSQ